MKQFGLKLLSAGYAVPEREITSEELETMMDFEKFGIRKGMSKLLSGVSKRGFAADNEDSSDYAVRAGKMALDLANMDPTDIDLLLFCSITSDFMEPATAMKVREDLGCQNANCYDIKNACNAFLTGLEIANMYIETRRAENILLVSGEILSRYLKLHYDTVEEIENANATFSLGDAGGAIVVTAKEVKSDADRMKSIFKSSSEFWNDGILWGDGTRYAHQPEMGYFQNETKQMIKTNFARATKFYANAMREFEISIDDVALFIPHQITKYLTLKSCEILGLPLERTVDLIGNHGNIGCASIPLAIAQNLESGKIQIGKGQQIVIFGFGNGVSMALMTLYI
jgi:3-oxoacyl-(acyl-carrier-protein) synthase III